MHQNEKRADRCGGELTNAELSEVIGGELSDAVRFFIAALASPSPYNPKEPEYSGFDHMIGTCPK
jgi:hypothetical protein